MVKIAVVGCGVMGAHHARVYSELNHVELVAVADVDEAKSKGVAEKYDTKAYTDYRSMISSEKPDAVSVASPTTLHKDITLFALESGAHVLVEKPIAHTIEAAWEMVHKAREKGLKLMVGHIERFNPAVQELKNMIDGGEVGDIVSMSARRVGPFTNRITDVGVIIDIAVHDIDIMSYLFGDTIETVCASAGDSGGALETYAMMMLKFNEGGVGIIETNRLTPKKIRELTVTGTKGVAIADYIDQSLTLYNGKAIPSNIDKAEPLRNELEHFIDCIQSGSNPLVNGVEGIHALEVALKAVSSYKNNCFEEMAHNEKIRALADPY